MAKDTSTRTHPTRSVEIPKVRIDLERYHRYMKAIKARGAKGEKDIVTYSFCVREALDQWSDAQLKG